MPGRWIAPVGILAHLAVLTAPSAYASLNISTAPTQHVAVVGNTCTATAATAVLNVTQLETLLASHNVTVFANSTAEDINVTTPVTWSSANSLTIDASRTIGIYQPVTATGTGGVSLFWNSGAAGTLVIASPGKVSLAKTSSTLITNQGSSSTTWTLANSVASLASAIANNPSGNIALSADYDATPDGVYSKSPIGAELNQGNVWGFGNTISNLQINDPVAGHSVGLFKFVSSQSTVEYLNLAHVSVQGAGSTSSGGAEMVGGLAAEVNQATLMYDTVSGPVRGGSGDALFVGGLVGLANQSTILHCHSGSGVTAGSGPSTSGVPHGPPVGGLVGVLNDGSIRQSSAVGSVSGGANARVGGLVGSMGTFLGTSNVKNSYAWGNVTTGTGGYAGGLVGASTGSTAAHASSIDDSYSMGMVSAAGAVKGGLIGVDQSPSGSNSDDYWDTTTSGIANASGGAGTPAHDPGITGLTTTQLKSGLPTGFLSTTWVEKSTTNNGLPYLISPPH